MTVPDFSQTTGMFEIVLNIWSSTPIQTEKGRKKEMEIQ